MPTQDAVLHAKAIEIGKLAVRATTAAKTGHPTSALSLAHLTTVLMYRVMRWDPARPDDPDADRLVLSEGHAVPILYAACADLGVMFSPADGPRRLTVDDLDGLRAIDSPLDGHPNPRAGFAFFDAATGSLGQGLSIAAGLGAAARLDGSERRIYCLIGDGESREGQIWEAMDFIADQGLRNVVAIFNCNSLGQSDFVSSAQSPEALAAKALAFGWHVVTIDGHAPGEIQAALATPADRPLCVIARTVKGWGVPSLGGMGHHGSAVKQDQQTEVIAALDHTARALGADTVSADAARDIHPPRRRRAPDTATRTPDGFTDALAGNRKVQASVDEGALSPRRGFGLALHALGAANPAVVSLDGDVKNSTYAQDFADAYPDRYFEGRIAEQNMVSAAVGLAAAGKIPFVSSFGKFLVRAYDQIELAMIGGANIKLVGTHIGVTIAADGPSQMALADVAFMRAYAHARDYRGGPAMVVLTPSDAPSAYALTLSMAAHDGACYLRAVRGDLPILYTAEDRFPFGGHKLLRNAGIGAGGIVLVACGYMVHSCLAAAEALEARGIAVSLVDAYALPMETGPVLQLAREQEGGIILTVEDSYTGGIGSELADAAARARAAPRVHSMNVSRIPKSGRSPDDLLAYVNLSVDDIVRTAASLVQEG
ncbi:transketolase [Lichenicoccus sp.]|uniref:transketolase n=1 Tax=Lichenicoccus sp. TaxID=2781899 RepID=UPI003D0C4DAA